MGLCSSCQCCRLRILPSRLAVPTIAGAPSGLLVSRSATRGTRVFRLRRDDELLRLMLLGACRQWLSSCMGACWAGEAAGAACAHSCC